MEKIGFFQNPHQMSQDGTAVMSARGTANLFSIKHTSLQSVAGNWPPESLKPFIDKDFSVAVDSVKVTAGSSLHKGRNMTVYDSFFIESMIRAYALAFDHGVLKQNQEHICQ